MYPPERHKHRSARSPVLGRRLARGQSNSNLLLAPRLLLTRLSTFLCFLLLGFSILIFHLVYFCIFRGSPAFCIFPRHAPHFSPALRSCAGSLVAISSRRILRGSRQILTSFSSSGFLVISHGEFCSHSLAILSRPQEHVGFCPGHPFALFILAFVWFLLFRLK